MARLACGPIEVDYLVVLRFLSGQCVLVSSVAAVVFIGLILWPAAAAGGHSAPPAAGTPLAGDLDPSFGSAGVVTHDPGYLGAIAVQADGKVVVAGSRGPNDGVLLARYLPNGSPDPSFGDGGYVETQSGLPTAGVTTGAVALQPDGKIVVAGSSGLGDGSQAVYGGFGLARFNPDGSPDTTFGTDGVTNTIIPGDANEFWSAGADALAILPGGEILAGGWSFSQTAEVTSAPFALAEYTPDGSLDPAFGKGGIVQTPFTAAAFLSSLTVRQDGKIVASGSNVAGSHGDDIYEMAIARYDPNGSLDPTFGTAGQVQTVEKLHYEGGPSALQDGKIVVAGFRSNDKGFARFPVIARFGAGGHVDPTFGKHGYEEIRSLAGDAVSAVVTQRGGKILLATNSAVLRLLPNGRLDPSFGRKGVATLGPVCRAGADGGCGSASLALQADGNVLVDEPRVSAYDSSSSFALARLVGGNNCVVPALRGKTVSKARAKLKASYCNTGVISRLYSNRVARGRVITTAPVLGDRRPAGTKVELVVSRGKPVHRS